MTKNVAAAAGLSDRRVFAVLKELALDLSWSWNHYAHLLWKQLDPELWERTRNPLLVLQTISRERLLQVAATTEFNECLRNVVHQRKTEQRLHPRVHDSACIVPSIAYFSMEYMLTEALPIYSGGLGNVAGDQLKAANDLGVPVTGIGLLFQEGYFRQEIDANGEQHAFYPFNNPGELPITPVRTKEGEWVRVKITRPDFTIWVRAWQAKIGLSTLYLLDTNDPANDPVVRLIGSELYGGGSQLRLRQEILLGIGGWRLLRELGIEPPVCHLNEGHAAFAVLERARCFMQDNSVDFQTALVATRAGTVFTTHTPVAAGFDRFAPALMESHLRHYAEELLQISFKELMSLGRKNPQDETEPFNMAYLAIRGSSAVNGVSRVHGEVSRRIFQELFPRWSEAEVPVGHVTNGIHVPTWASAEAVALWNRGLQLENSNITPVSISGHIREDALTLIPDDQLWDLRCKQRTKLVGFVRRRLAAQRAAVGAPLSADTLNGVLSPDILTLGFARRFAEYKRPPLLLRDPERFARILTDPDRPAQLVLAGKAHPADEYGKSAIKQWHEYIKKYGLENRVVFLADYDMQLTQKLVRGTDLWINTPRRPWEASGTSGMKILVNGGLNLSELDGWWAEAYTPQVGWAIDGTGAGSDEDGRDAEQLYRLLEDEAKPAFYGRNASGIPTGWVARMRASMITLTPMFSAYRTVGEYLEQYYRPAAAGYKARAADGALVSKQIVEWLKTIENAWPSVSILSRSNVRQEGITSDSVWQITAVVQLGSLSPDDVLVELFADKSGAPPFRQRMSLERSMPESNSTYEFKGMVSAERSASDYTVRIVPFHADVHIPLETNRVVWET